MAERRQDKTFSQTRRGAASDGAAETADFPFPVKPVCLRNGLNTSTQGAINNLCDFNMQNISKQEASHGLAKEIQMREQILREKLHRLGEKIRRHISKETGDSAEEDRKMPQREQQSGEDDARKPAGGGETPWEDQDQCNEDITTRAQREETRVGKCRERSGTATQKEVKQPRTS